MVKREIWWEGTVEVLILPNDNYEARVRLRGETSVLIGTGLTPSDAINDALN